MVCRHQTAIFLLAALTFFGFLICTEASLASDFDDDDKERSYVLGEDSSQLADHNDDTEAGISDRAPFCKKWKKYLLTGLIAGKCITDLALIVFLAEHMQAINDLRGSLSYEQSKNCSAICLENIGALDAKARNAYLADGIVGITSTIGASLTDLLALLACVSGNKDAALMTMFLSSTCHLVTFLASIGGHVPLMEALEKNLGDLSPQVREKLEKVLSEAIKIIVPTSLEGLPLMIGSCCAFWRRK